MIFKMVFLIVFPSNPPYLTLFLILVGFISHSVFPINLYKNKETASQPLSGKYIFSLSHNIWENRNYSLSSTRKKEKIVFDYEKYSEIL